MMDQGSYRPRPNPQAGITRIDFGNKPTAETEGDECSSPCNGFDRPLLKSSEDDIITEVPRKWSNRTAIDIIRDSQATAKSSTYVPKAFINWSTITAGPKTKEEADKSKARAAREKAAYDELMRHPANQKRTKYQSLKFDPPTFALKGQTMGQYVQPDIVSRPKRTPEEEQAYQDEVYADLHGPQALLKRKREEQQERENPGSSKSKRLHQTALANGWKITVEEAEDFLEFCDTMLADRMAKWEQDENGALLPILKKAKPEEEKKEDA